MDASAFRLTPCQQHHHLSVHIYNIDTYTSVLYTATTTIDYLEEHLPIEAEPVDREQQQDLSMEARRTTLMSNGPLGNGHAGSALPVPSSAMKKPAMRMGPPRMSVAPNTGGGMRASTIGGGGGGGGGGGMTRMPSQENLQGRPSTMGARAGVDGVSSANRGDGGMYGRPSTVRVAPGR